MELMKKEDNRTFGLSLKRIRLSLNFLPYCFGVNTDLSLSKTNVKIIPYTPLYTMDFFSLIS